MADRAKLTPNSATLLKVRRSSETTPAGHELRAQDVRIVQFPHPGHERLPQPLVRGATLPWSTDPGHGRKFLLSPGAWIDDGGGERHGQVTFWGEWEPQSDVVALLPPGPGLPRALQRPWYSVEDTGWRQNTDPLVFGDRFSYTNCRQVRNAKLRFLPTGSVVLFGSKLSHGFVLDTVFVAAKASTYRPKDGPPVGAVDGGDELVADPIALDQRGADLALTWYGGATPADPVAGMYSFIPARPYDAGNAGFARPRIEFDGIVNTNLAMAARSMTMALEQARGIWEQVVERVFAAGLVLATHLPTPEHVMPSRVQEAVRAAGRC